MVSISWSISKHEQLHLFSSMRYGSFQFFPFVKTQGHSYLRRMQCPFSIMDEVLLDKGNNKITELRTILQRESQNS
jgi:hypothetical protein